MTTVILDAADIEALLFSTGAIKEIEASIRGRSNDPLVRQSAAKLTGAHDRVAAAWRRANRPEPEEPLPSDIAELQSLFAGPDGRALTEVVTGTLPTRLVQALQLVEAGPIWDGVKVDWPGAPEFRQAPSSPRDLRYAVRLTPRGMAALSAVRLIS